ncbi:aspartic peptidase domain-containing protein [Xylaria nigripes]|nr:aspartic peptidase domain-containing protein [Xylaria nigripes]
MASSLSLPLSLLCYLSAVSQVSAGSPTPYAATWSDTTYGPDGPWHAIQVTVGADQKIALFPGHEFQSFLLTTDYCNNNDTCPASKAHLYNTAQSKVDNTGSDGKIAYQPPPNFMSGLNVAGDPAQSWVDNVDMGDMLIPNVALALISNSYAAYPKDPWYPLSVGCLGVGAPGTLNQSFSVNSGSLINASLIPGFMKSSNKIPSNSFAMHIGSVDPPMPGSLYFGGYDQNRVVGKIISNTGDYTKVISLKDISIGVVDGSSPWAFESKSGLLVPDDDLNSGGINVGVDGCSPYLTLPKATCDAIAENLPVDYNDALGLYIWRQDDPKYSQIVSSASSMNFTFFAGSNTEEVVISVPFRHLNLTLTAPLVDNDQQYFPCYTGPSNSYTLGRAFLQDAFVGANWDSSTWWLAQAPGPNIPESNIVNINSDDTTIQASKNDWKASWDGFWQALTPEETVTTSPTETPSSGPALSVAASAGIGVAVGVVVVAALVLGLFCVYRRRKGSSSTDDMGSSHALHQPQPPHPDPYHNRDGYYTSVENIGVSSPQDRKEVYSPSIMSSPATLPPSTMHFVAELPATEIYRTELPVPQSQDPTSPHSTHRPNSPSPSHELPVHH